MTRREYAAITIAMLCLWTIADCVPDTTIMNVLCNAAVFTSGDPFAISLDYVLQELETVTSTQRNYDYSNISPYTNAFAYGHAATPISQPLTATPVLLPPRRLCSPLRYEQYPFDD
ncbi:hypothetical protein K1719_009827 [Acacia pycnantha]|nr:hypothetical protein K1719_009827 [Acacia pycnantha]